VGAACRFIQWLNDANSFCSTLVDRIVTGYPRDEAAALEAELGYHDGFLDTAEHFYLFVIQGPAFLAENCVWISTRLTC
jgi:tagaturonate reductase